MDFIEAPRVDKSAERASAAEMKFAGYFLNLGGIVLLLVGFVSYLKTATPGQLTALPAGMVQVGLGAGLGLVFLLAGEYLYRRGMEQFSHPIVTAGFCLLFFVVCSARFRYDLLGSSAFFTLLLLLVVASNASVFRFDSKLIGNAMSLVYFSTPLLLNFHFGDFNGLFLYLLSINLGTALVAWRKKWDFQLVVACLGSYSFFLLHGKEGSPLQVMALLLLIYSLSFLANNTIFFTRPENSSFNLFVSFVNPLAFAAFSSSAVVFHFSNWVPVTVYLTLALLHAAVAMVADRRRDENANFPELAGNNLLLSLLFACAAISYVTYFADDTSYFTLVTLLWFTLAHSLLQLGLSVARHRTLASRFSLFCLALASFQVYYVVSSMDSALLLKGTCALLFLAYYANMYLQRSSLSSEQVSFAKGSLLLAVGAFFILPAYHSADALVWSLAVALVAFAVLARGKHEKLFSLCFELTSVVLSVVAITLDSLPSLLGSGLLCVGAHVIARNWECELRPLHHLALGATWGRLLFLILLPHPQLWLPLFAAAALVCMKLEKVLLSLSLASLSLVGLALAPFSWWMEAWNMAVLLVVLLATAVSYALARRVSPLYAAERLEVLVSLVLFRWSFSAGDHPMSTLLWVVLAALLLRHAIDQDNWNLLGQGAFDAARLLLFLAFLKSVVYDANFVRNVTSTHFLFSFAVAAGFLLIAHAQVKKREARNGLMVAGLLVLCFQITFILHRQWGDLDLFQPLLSGFWSFTAFGIIAGGVMFQVKAYRLFGLSTMVASVLKILWVDIQVLDAYSQTNTYLILGSLLVSTSLLYQKQRARLTGEGQACPATLLPDFG